MNRIMTIESTGEGYQSKTISNYSYGKKTSFKETLNADEQKAVNAPSLSTITGIDIIADGRVSLSIGNTLCQGSEITLTGINASPLGILIKNIGKIEDIVKVLDVKLNTPSSGKATLTIDSRNYGRALLRGIKASGPFNMMEGKSFLLFENTISQSTIIMSSISKYDQNGNKYIYNVDDANMEQTFQDGGVTYGAYKNITGTIMANALQRAINQVKGSNYSTVEYKDERFYVYINNPLNINIKITNQPGDYVAATALGLQDGGFYPSTEKIINGCLEIGGNEYKILSNEGETIVIDTSTETTYDYGNIVDLANLPTSDFGFNATHIICAQSGRYTIYTDKNSPTKKVTVMLLGGQYRMNCWKITTPEGERISTLENVYVCRQNDSDIIMKDPNKTISNFPWDNNGHMSVVTKEQINAQVMIYGD